MPRTPDISVIVPVYNKADRLPDCLDGLLTQTCDSYEIILVDDGATDLSGLLCQHCACRSLHDIKLVSADNGGVSNALNRGLAMATGTWIAFCDADDVALPDWLRTLRQVAVSDQAQLCCCTMQEISAAGTRLVGNLPLGNEPCLRLTSADDIERRLVLPLLGDKGDVHAYKVLMLFRRDIIRRHRLCFATDVTVEEDTLFCIDYLQRISRLTALNLPLYRYLRLDSSLCGTYYSQRASDHKRELNWRNWSRAALRIAGSGSLFTRHPWLKPRLQLRCLLHHAQEISCRPRLSCARRHHELRALAREARACDVSGYTLSRAERLFLELLRHVPSLMPLVCWLKRQADKH